MKDVLVLSDLEQIKAISHTYRIEIIESFDDSPATAKQVADKLKEPHAKVNYHIKTLQKVGVLELVEEKVKLGIVEKYYLPAAKTFVIDKSILNISENNVMQSINQALISIFENISKDFYKSIEYLEEREQANRILYYNDYYLADNEVEELQNQITRVIQDYCKDKKDIDRENTSNYSIASLIIPRINIKK